MRVALGLALVLGVAWVGAAAAGSSAVAGCRQVASGGYAPTWIPGGKIAYAGPGSFANRVVVTGVDGQAPRCAVASLSRSDTLQEVRWGPGGRLVYADTDFTLFSRDPRSSRVHTLRHDLGNVGNGESIFSLSPNGREIAFTADCRCSVELGTRVGVMSELGGRVTWLSGAWPGEAEDPSWSRLGREVAFSIPSGIAVVPVAHGGRPVLFRLPARCLSTSWSPNGRWIACLSPGGGIDSTLEIVDTSGGRTRSVLGRFSSFCWSPSSKMMAVQGPGAVIDTVSVTGGSARVALPNGLRPGADPPAWSPDGRWIAFSAIGTANDLDRRVYVIRPDGRDLRRVG